VAISKSIPAFVLSVTLLAYIWYNHSVWSRRFGLEDGITVFLSVALVMVVLVFIYPLKMMFAGLFAWLSAGYLSSQIKLNSFEELRIMFIFFAIGFALITLLFSAFHGHALRFRKELKLSAFEIHETGSDIRFLLSMAMVCLLALILSLLVPAHWLPFAGFVYMLNWPFGYWIQYQRNRQWHKKINRGLS
jgi:hypothetical protein